jgi:peptidoglycan/LPS O-acetylase OafA/YrhL
MRGPGEPTELRRLNSLRGIAALIVLVSHYSNESGLWGKALGLGAGQVGVMVFFLLSAFLMSYLYLDREPTRRALSSFATARFARVIPLYVLVVVASFVASLVFPEGLSIDVYHVAGWRELVSHLLMLRGNGLLRTIPPEIHFYVIFALAWMLHPRLRSMLFVLIAATGVAVALIANGKAVSATFLGLDATFLIFRAFPFFAVGMLLGSLFSRWQAPARLRSHGFVIALALIPLTFPAPFRSLTGSNGGWSDERVLALLAAAFFAIVFLVPDNDRLLENPVGDFLGKVSYSLYLLHYPLLRLLLALGVARGPLGLVLFLGLALFGSYVSYRMFEWPMRQAIRSRRTVTQPVNAS